MTGVAKARLLREDGTDAKANLYDVLRDYSQATENFARGLRQSLSDYDLMVVKQKYLLAAAAVIKGVSKIFGYKDISTAASFFEAAACAYLDNYDLRAYHQGLDKRFALDEESSRVLRSRLKIMAEKADRIGQLYSRELPEATDTERSALKFLIELVLELPTGAWECAPCLAVTGDCIDCGYGRDHGICSHPGSTYEMLSGSREAILESVRRGLTERGRRSGTRNLLQKQNMQFDSSDKSPFIQMESDICGENDIVELCD